MEGEKEEEVAEIVDKNTGEPLDWGAIFFRLHHYCNLDKWKIFEYTLPQISELMRHTNNHIEFQVEVMTAPMKAMFGGGASTDGEIIDTEYREITEDDISELMSALSN